MDRYEKDIFAVLVDNMREMETELRAQSIVFEALASKVVDVQGMGEAPALARESQVMRKLVLDKYQLWTRIGSGIRAITSTCRLSLGTRERAFIH